jgi:PAS domain S-box-containing protein
MRMTISRRLNFAAAVPLMVAAAVCVALIISWGMMAGAWGNGNGVRVLRSNITEVNSAAYSYVLYHEDRPKGQFYTEYDALMAQVAHLNPANRDQKELLNNISQNGVAIKDIFSRLVSNYETVDPSFDPQLARQADDRLVAQYLARSQSMDVDAAHLRDMVDSDIQNTQMITAGLVFLILLAAVVPLTIALGRTRRHIVSSLDRIKAGMGAVGSGNLVYSIGMAPVDELGDLACSFDHMTSNLREVTASKSDLEREVEERRWAELALQASEERWSTTLASIGDGVIATDLRSNVTYMNAVAVDLTGWTLREALGKPIAQILNIVHEKSRQAVDNPVTRVLNGGVIVGLANHTILIRKDGTEIPIDDSGAPIRGVEGETTGVVLVFRDIAERKKAEQMKDDFIGLVSHELKTPITVIVGAIDTAVTPGLTAREKRQLLDDAASSAEQLAHIVDNLLELSRAQANRLAMRVEPVAIARTAEAVINKLKAVPGKHRLIVDMPGMPIVSADPVRVERILHNLIENAIKYSPRGGDVKVAARTDREYLVVSVEDHGIGIPPGDQARLFRHFERLDMSPAIGGVGLGLIVAQRLVEAHNGRIWLESEPGKGTTFLFTLPLT